ncbi:hypothetical protein BJF78_08345 [Pseudonocardia sp. CNS-139]|nr:hypothetical protein BJF78_08345 [Pseudonocardia sp. CNS-139]
MSLGGTVTGTPSIHSIPESVGPAPPLRVVSSSVSMRRPTLCSSMIRSGIEGATSVMCGPLRRSLE